MRKSNLLILASLTITLLASCASGNLTDKDASINNSTNGLWQQVGYGRILALNDSTIKVYDLNDSFCMLTFEEEILDFGRIVWVRNDTLTIQHGIDHWKCTRIKELPVRFKNHDPKDLHDAVLNYDVFWQTFHENYCSFDLKNIDWVALNEKYRPTISARTTDLELYLVFEEMISLLEDGHIEMPVPDALEEEYKSASNDEPRKYNILDVFETAESLGLLYVDSLRTFNAGMTRWGMIENNVGYLQINAMLMQADYNLPEGLSLQEFEVPYWVDNVSKRKDEIHRQDEADGMKATLDRILTEMPEATSFIVDLRFNTGGKDGVAMEIINHFSTFQEKMASKYVHEKGQFVNHQNIVNTPARNGFDGPVFLLTSHLTASASELAVLCSLTDDQFTRIGSQTEGIFSSTLDKVLPNGWEYMFSNEVYVDLNGVNYEHVGIAPDIEIKYAKVRDEFIDMLKHNLKLGKDEAIESALQKIRAQ